MNTIRREQILEFVKAKKAVSLKELCNAFSYVSTMTLHRDLDYLDKKGSIERVRGGARYINPNTDEMEPAFVDREISNIEKKEIIAQKAVSLIKNGSSIYIDSGTTTMALSKKIPDIPLSIITNSPNIALCFADKELLNLTVCGGTFNKQNLSLYGSYAISTLEKINIDVAFIVASGYSQDTLFTCGNDGETIIKNLVCKKARKVVLLIDSSKLDTVLPFTFATLEDIDTIVCDSPLPDELSKRAREMGISVL